MLPNVENASLYRQQEARLAWTGLQERVLFWLHGIHDSEVRHPAIRGSKDRKRHSYSPYPKRREPFASPVLSHITQPEATPEFDLPASASEILPLWHAQENVDRVEYRTTSLIEFKVADDLPDPEYNPLITFFAADIEEEYCRLLFLCNKLEVERVEVDLRWKRDLSHAAMRELLDIELSIQRVLKSAQYIIDYSHHFNLNVDFQTLFLQHCRYPFQQLSPDKPVHHTQYYGENAPQHRSHYIQDVQEQGLSGFECQDFTNLNSDLWAFK